MLLGARREGRGGTGRHEEPGWKEPGVRSVGRGVTIEESEYEIQPKPLTADDADDSAHADK